MGICCSFLSTNNEGEPAFINEDAVVPEGQRAEDEQEYENTDNQQDGAPLLKTTEMKLVTITDSSDGSFNEEMISKMMAEVEDSSD
ncbi:hypothetical protein TRFO_16815 [Tritrichomonas foetus]|uniref:Uncharacterized protein n=1 Tax=Tritrichomonas foetus TaxID=1144522 RepID=A0A1J4KPD3_9EUKA|nr:hypothetical protein TRFO_16815 [Tritrichomonas foetus]|eukprot:OHT13151.1 hypothetical protein TRFO_16815 [Tritrichomonas foetus]